MIFRNFALLIFAVVFGLTAKGIIAQDTEQLIASEAVAPAYHPIQLIATPDSSIRVEIKVKVNAAGNVISAERLSGLDVASNAQKAAMKWKFLPSPQNLPERQATLTFVFRRMAKDAKEDELASIFRLPFQIEVRRREPEIHVD